jgi:hypothetical protein
VAETLEAGMLGAALLKAGPEAAEVQVQFRAAVVQQEQ